MRKSCGLKVVGYTLQVALLALAVMLLLAPSVWAEPGPEPGLPAGPLAGPQAGVIIRCNPAAAITSDSTSLSTDLYVQDVVGLYGVDLRLNFDVSSVNVVDAAPGAPILPFSTFLKPDWILVNQADNVLGSVRYANTQLNPTPIVCPTVPCSGAVARVNLRGLRAGEHTLTYSTLWSVLKDVHGVTIPATTQSCTVRFWGPIDLTIHRTGPASNTLDWSFLGTTVTNYEVWRSTTAPYLTPGGAGGGALVSWPIPATYLDNLAGPADNQYYVVRAVQGVTNYSLPSKRVGAFHYSLVPGLPGS